MLAKATAGDGDGVTASTAIPGLATQHRMPSQQSKRQQGVGSTWPSAAPSTRSAIARAATILKHMARGIVWWLPSFSWLQFCETGLVNRLLF